MNGPDVAFNGADVQVSSALLVKLDGKIDIVLTQLAELKKSVDDLSVRQMFSGAAQTAMQAERIGVRDELEKVVFLVQGDSAASTVDDASREDGSRSADAIGRSAGTPPRLTVPANDVAAGGSLRRFFGVALVLIAIVGLAGLGAAVISTQPEKFARLN